MTDGTATVPCETCGEPVHKTDARRCGAHLCLCLNCWEIECRLTPYLARGGDKARGFVIAALAGAGADLGIGEAAHDAVNHPQHYTSHPSGVECITVVEHFNFNRGNAMKYIWRAGEKGNEVEDLKKAAWYLHREIERISGEKS